MESPEQLHDAASGLYVRRRAALGEASQPVRLLLVHGLGESGLCFEPLLRDSRLAELELIAVDLPGYGKSPLPPRAGSRRDSLGDHAERLAGLISSWTRPPVLVGHSMGGVIGTLLAERHPQLVRAFVDVEGNLSPGDCVFSAQATAHSAASFVTKGFAGLLDSVYRQGLEDPPMRTYFASMSLCDPRLFHHNASELVAMSAAEDLAARLARLPMPCCYLAGVPRGGPERSHELLRAAGIEPTVVAPAGHWPFLDQPARFVDELLAFVRCHPNSEKCRQDLISGDRTG